jgi:hypothetical protein
MTVLVGIGGTAILCAGETLRKISSSILTSGENAVRAARSSSPDAVAAPICIYGLAIGAYVLMICAGIMASGLGAGMVLGSIVNLNQSLFVSSIAAVAVGAFVGYCTHS